MCNKDLASNMSSDRLDPWDNHPHKKKKYSPATTEKGMKKKDAKPSSKTIESFPKSNRWVVKRSLGRCSHSSVYSARSTMDGAKDNLPFEMTIKSAESLQASRIMIEENYLKRLESPFVVSCYGHEITMEINENDPSSRKIYYNTILENCKGKTLKKHMRKNKGKLPEDDVKRLASDILLGLKYIHGEEIIHCDIRPKNILLKFGTKRFGCSHGFRAKISGFGKALKKGSLEYNEEWGQRRRGTKGYMSPELMRDMDLDYGADVWAFGCTVFEMLNGEHVWGEYDRSLSREGLINLIGKSSFVPKIHDSLSKEAKDFLTKCLEKDPVKRWSVDSLLKHRFLTWDDEEDEEEEEVFYDEIEYVDAEEDEEEDEEEEEGFYDEIEYVDVEEDEEVDEIFFHEMFFDDLEAYLAREADFGGEEHHEVIDIDEEYPKEDSDKDGLKR